MRAYFRIGVLGQVAIVPIVCSLGVVVRAAEYEGPPKVTATQILSASEVKGPHHTVAPEVKTEGYLHLFEITSDYGPLEAEGRSLLLMRLHEIGALAELDKVSKSEVFVKAAGTSVVNVGKGVASAVADPSATVKGVGAGVKRFGTNLGRKAKRTGAKAVDAATQDEAEKKQEASTKPAGTEKSTTDKAAGAAGGVANSVTGASAASRRWAQKVGVDPYTTNPILKKALADIGKVDAAGGLATKILVPIPKLVSGTASVGGLVWSKDPEALLKINEQKLKELGVPGETIKELYLSKGFSLTLQTRFATHVRMVNVPGCADYVSTAAEADTEREAIFFVEGAEMLARFHQKTPVARLLTDSRALVAKTTDGRVVVLLPLDFVRWTAQYEKALSEVEQRAKAELGGGKLEMHLSGQMSSAAKKEMAARGFTLVENVPSTFEVARARAKAASAK